MTLDQKELSTKVVTRKDAFKDHRLKYHEINYAYTQHLCKLREIIESLPKDGQRYSEGLAAINGLQNFMQEVVKDFDALAEGSDARNVLTDYAATLLLKESEIDSLTQTVKNLNTKLREAKRN